MRHATTVRKLAVWEGQVTDSVTKSLSAVHSEDATSLERLFAQFLLAAFIMATPTIWCLTIDHEKKPIGMLFKVILENDIGDLRKKVKEENSNDLKDVDAHH